MARLILKKLLKPKPSYILIRNLWRLTMENFKWRLDDEGFDDDSDTDFDDDDSDSDVDSDTE